MEKSEIDKLLATADRRAVYINQVEHAKEKFRTLNILAWDGHIFELDPSFVCYVLLQFMSSQADGDMPIILFDKNSEPVLIEDLSEFVDQMQEKHTEALNEYLDIYSRLQ
ncbi:unnamed protein product, partial [marine sediment metagenome]